MEKDLNTLFEAHYPELVAWCSRHSLKHWGDPEDFVHQAYCRCQKHWSVGCSTPGREAAYFYRALRWVLQDAARKFQRRQHRLRGIFRQSNQRAGQTSIAGELTAQEALGALTPSERAICLAFLQGHPPPQVCRELGLSLTALATHLSRARQKLLRELTACSQC